MYDVKGVMVNKCNLTKLKLFKISIKSAVLAGSDRTADSLSFLILFYLGETGEITSPNYPYNYPNNKLCTWTITGQPDRAIKVTFLSFDVEREWQDCNYDWVRAFRGLVTYDQQEIFK